MTVSFIDEETGVPGEKKCSQKNKTNLFLCIIAFEKQVSVTYSKVIEFT
jgi:hypothetical protein